MQANPTQLLPRAQQRGAGEHQPVPSSHCRALRGWMGLCAGLLSDLFCSPSCSAPTASRYRAETKGFFLPHAPLLFSLITLSTPNPRMICAFHTLSVLLLSVRTWILSISQLKTFFFSFPPVVCGFAWQGIVNSFTAHLERAVLAQLLQAFLEEQKKVLGFKTAHQKKKAQQQWKLLL